MRQLYTFGIRLYWLVAILLYPFNTKAKKWVFGRLNWRNNLPPKTSKKRVWFHCASLGEFEQARPTIEKIAGPDIDIILSFFSPSGYEIRKNYELASYVFYLPIDTPINAKDLIEGLQPSLMVFVKYDVWPNLLKEAHRKAIPVTLISAVFRKDQIYFKTWGTFFRNALKSLNTIFVQDENSKILLSKIGVESKIAGDVRFDRAQEVLNSNFEDDFLDSFCAESTVLVFGSTYNVEHHWLKHLIAELTALNNSIKVIIAPHQVDSDHLHEVKSHFPNAYYYTKHKEKTPKFESKVLVLDTIGLLTFVYRYADLAYVGGGFGKSLHNALEAAVYGIPVVVGPNHIRFPEVDEMEKSAGIIQVNNQAEFKRTITSFCKAPKQFIQKGKLNKSFMENRAGASQKIVEEIQQILNP